MQASRTPLCFVTMPFGRKEGLGGILYDFDAIYSDGIRPAIVDAGFQVMRADEEDFGGLLYKKMFERIIESDLLVADLTTLNANLFYELGIRHAARSGGTIVVVADSERLPFDMVMLRSIPYECQDGKLSEASCRKFRTSLSEVIKYELAGDSRPSSPLFTLLDGFPGIKLPAQSGGAEVFLSYAREDETRVLNAHASLERQGFRPWIDQKNIKPGERWELAIETALRRADFILLFLSDTSVNKRGYLRREIRDALDQSHEMLDTDIFLIPVRLEDCEVPRELKHLHWVDLFSDDGMDRLVEVLRNGRPRQ